MSLFITIPRQTLVQQTQSDVRQAAAKQLKSYANNAFVNAASTYATIYSAVFLSAILPPQSIFDNLATDGHSLIALLQTLAAVVENIQPGTVQALPPFTVNADGSVTLG